MKMTSSYDEYSLKKLDEWINDVMNCDVSPEEIYETITKAIEENVDYHQNRLERSQKLISLLKGSQDTLVVGGNTSPDIPTVTQTDWDNVDKQIQEFNELLCNKESSQEEKDLCEEYNVRETEFWNKRKELESSFEQVKLAGGYEWTSNKNDQQKVVKWVLPVQHSVGDGDEYFVILPDDLLSQVNWKEGDQLEWVFQDDNSYLLRRVNDEE